MNDYAAKERAAQEARAEYTRRSLALAEIIKPLRDASYECHHDWRYFPKALADYARDYGGLEMSPDYQRGHVWTPYQQQHYIENVLRGVISSAGFVVQFNCPNWEDDNYQGDLPRGLQCIDGLQRVTAALQFLEGNVRPFGLVPDDLVRSRFSVRGSTYRFQIAIYNFQTRAELLQHYLDLNAGGTPHEQAELDRVRALLAAAKANTAQ